MGLPCQEKNWLLVTGCSLPVPGFGFVLLWILILPSHLAISNPPAGTVNEQRLSITQEPVTSNPQRATNQ
jgi:hypothetical protein